MAKYIDAEKLEAEIERLRKDAWTSFQKGNSTEDQYYLRYGVIQDIISFIDSFQQEQPEVDLEKDFSKAWAIHPIPKEFIQDLLEERGLLEFIHKTARHFYELGKNSK